MQTIIRTSRLLRQAYAPDFSLPPLIYMSEYRAEHNPLHSIKIIRPMVVIIREYAAPDQRQARIRLIQSCQKLHLPFIISADYQLAIKYRAVGVHLPRYLQKDCAFIRSKLPSHMIITASAHSLKDITRHQYSPIDASLLSPIFATSSHPDALPVPRQILRQLQSVTKNTQHPIYALGGIQAKNVGLLRHYAISGLAGISFFRR